MTAPKVKELFLIQIAQTASSSEIPMPRRRCLCIVPMLGWRVAKSASIKSMIGFEDKVRVYVADRTGLKGY